MADANKQVFENSSFTFLVDWRILYHMRIETAKDGTMITKLLRKIMLAWLLRRGITETMIFATTNAMNDKDKKKGANLKI